jgi:hypothetical protein
VPTFVVVSVAVVGMTMCCCTISRICRPYDGTLSLRHAVSGGTLAVAIVTATRMDDQMTAMGGGGRGDENPTITHGNKAVHKRASALGGD